MNNFAALLACALAVAAAPARACTDPGGIGGTGIDGGGIGGTGQRAESDVGVLGVVTGFASICVNGIEVHYDATTPVSVNGEPASAAALAVGKVVAVHAVGAGTQARARAIDVVDAAVGPVTAVQSGGTMLEVQGQRVHVGAVTLLGGGLSRGELAAGQALRVSGLRGADGAIVATHIEPAAPGARAFSAEPTDPGLARFVVQGYVGELQPQALRMGGASFSVPPELSAQLDSGRLVRLSGRRQGAERVVERADVLAGPLDVRAERSFRVEPRPSGADERRGRSGRDADSSGRGGPERGDRSGRGGGERPDRIERPERPDRSGRR